MNYLKSILLTVFLSLLLLNNNAKGQAEIRKVLEEPETIHLLDLWQLEEFKGTEKEEFMMNAFEYKKTEGGTNLSGIQLSLLIKTEIKVDNSSTKNSNNYYAYIDETEFPKLMLTINRLYKEVKYRLRIKKYSHIFYKTKDNITIGFTFTKQKKVAFFIFENEKVSVKCELPDPEKFFDTFYKKMDITNKKLYLPENLRKLKNVKKSKSKNVKDVNVDDI